MKKYVVSIMFLIILLICSNSYATVFVENKVAIIGKDVTIPIKSDIPLGSYTILLEQYGNLEFVNSAGQEGSGKKIITGSSLNGETELASFTFHIPDNTREGETEIKIKAIGMETPNLEPVSSQEIVTKINIRKNTPGDTNGDGTINILDAIKILNQIKSNETTYEEVICYDANNDGKIDILDVIRVINIAKGKI